MRSPVATCARKAGLNRSILEHGWHQFETFLAYKLEAAGGRLVKVDPRNTSRTCNECGSIDARHRESQARFACDDCGHEAHADVNAARTFSGPERGPRWRSPSAANLVEPPKAPRKNPLPSGRGRR
ncbi:zinc ribbon domain-containing protein [Bradyrhizobium arachidis]|uniref:zinc ribbon domain-containing protein n=1 Tax=Bradyrhizobium arachidis TaxID=858423 RepID=UPI00220A6F48|nr:transposase [Bradyrhizobium arachidis]